jgi:serine/threonine-protein kinase
VLKALAKKREDRFQTAKEFSDAFIQGIEASLRQARREPAAATDVPTQRIDPKLVQAARMLAGMQQARTDARAEPPSKAAAAAAAQSPAALPGGGKARILFVDDEERIVNALRSIFRSGYHVFTATNGTEALEFVRKFQPHVVVSDQRMPQMTGVELLRRVKGLAPSTVRMLLTGYSDLAAIVGSINEGEVYRFISKPWDNQEIQAIVAEAATIAFDLAATAASPPIVPERMDAGILVIEAGDGTLREITRLVGGACPVYHARSLDEGLSQLETHEIAVIVADIASRGAEIVAAFKALKRERPEILAIVLTEASDSELVIELINQAQIFRFIHKPVNPELLRQHTQGALIRYQTIKQNPHLARQYQVPAASLAGVSQGILARVKALKSWF